MIYFVPHEEKVVQLAVNKIFYSSDFFKDGSGFVRFDELPEAECAVFYYSFVKPCDLYLGNFLRVICGLKKYKKVLAIVPFMPFLREKDDLTTLGIIKSCHANLKIITLDPHIQHEMISAVQPRLFQSMISQDALLVFPDTGAGRYMNMYTNDYVQAKKDRLQGVHFSDAQRIAGRDCVILDDIIDTGYTLNETIKTLYSHGARKVSACITHCLNGKFDKPQGLENLSVCDTLETNSEYNVCDYTLAFRGIEEIVKENL